jgi:predicted membrane channel-forming protein YqfA (hemolysin III family)
MKKRYCSAVCYSAGEHRTTQYLAACTIPIVGLPLLILSLLLLSEPTAFYVGVAMFLIALFLVYSAASIYLVVAGRNERRIQHEPKA